MPTLMLHKIIDNQPLYYSDEGHGPVIIFCHGLLTSSTMWRSQINTLSSQYRCIAIDFWGHGQTTTIPETTQNLQDVAQQVLTLMDLLNIKSAAIIGHGSGGAIAAELVLYAPVRINALIMLNSFVGFEPQVNCVKYQGLMAQIANEQTISTALAHIISPLFFSKDIEQLIDQDAKLDAVVEQFRVELTTYSSAQITVLLKFANMAIFKRDTLEFVEALTLPTLVVASLRGYLRTALESYLMHDSIDGSQLLNIEQAGHLANIEKSNLFNQHLIDFLDKINFN
ncbi:alpha/beta fold hydrolase [Shewanella livingstonensis]|uniref:Alpha/beta hydrolase n=1 Tax=Shewanella livingstonensis TaxID=150120 RepID=A0A3G8LVP7_9GAMM|nr:alpha/beta hydrolase [Shewanella livingstonensis]AZG73587.1 alpha/beta hydrolase [Shewanella livingstonensis]